MTGFGHELINDLLVGINGTRRLSDIGHVRIYSFVLFTKLTNQAAAAINLSIRELENRRCLVVLSRLKHS